MSLHFRYQQRLFFAHYFYKLRILPCRRYQKIFYKIAIVKRNNSVIEVVGFVNPFLVLFRLSYKNIQQPLMFSKTIGIDRFRVMFWLSKGVISTPSVFFLLHQMGLTKTQSLSIKNSSRILSKFFIKRGVFNSDDFKIFFQRNAIK